MPIKLIYSILNKENDTKLFSKNFLLCKCDSRYHLSNFIKLPWNANSLKLLLKDIKQSNYLKQNSIFYKKDQLNWIIRV